MGAIQVRVMVAKSITSIGRLFSGVGLRRGKRCLIQLATEAGKTDVVRSSAFQRGPALRMGPGARGWRVRRSRHVPVIDRARGCHTAMAVGPPGSARARISRRRLMDGCRRLLVLRDPLPRASAAAQSEIRNLGRETTVTSHTRLVAAVRRLDWRSAASALAIRLRSVRAAEWIAGWPPPLVAMLCGVVAVRGIATLWHLPAGPMSDPLVLKISAAALFIAAFPLLVLERIYAAIAPELLPEAPQLNRLLRVPLTTCLVLAAANSLISVGFAMGGVLRSGRSLSW